ncbi:MAG: PilZ domain-containing protein [Candidatus Omnitrophota bacterium]
MEEKRKFIRLDVGVNVKWKKLYDEIFEDTSINKDISEGGICLIIEERLQIGDRLQLEIGLPDKKSITAVGRVAWVSEYGVVYDNHKRNYDTGVEFMEIEDMDRQEISKFVFRGVNNN